ncbi:MAG: hypothetical protein JWM64_2847 [Frankiales bacterium]|nr:hypothetical protein [Frankiales bacterium]
MAPRPARRTARDLTGLGLGALLVLLGLRLLGAERGTLLDLLVGALPLVLLTAYPLLLAALLLRARLLSALGAVVVAGHLAVVAPAVGAEPVPGAARDAPRLRVVTANLYVGNPDPEQAGRSLRALHPDVLVVPELTPKGLAGLRGSGLLDDLPHEEVGLAGRAEGVGLFSRLPLSQQAEEAADVRLLPRATVRVGGVDVRVLAGHPLPPVMAWEPLWRSDLRALAKEVRATALPVVVAGDLNSDRDHAPFRDLLDTGLRDAADARGQGLARTWPASRPLLQLDHVLVRDGRGGRLVVLHVEQARVTGSDHLAVVADLAMLSG